MIGWRIKVNLVFFLVGSLGLSYLMANQILSVLQERYSVYAQFRDAGGVFTNQEVTYRGITVGQVGEMEVTDDGVSIELEIDKEFDAIPKEDIEARVMFKSAVGEQFVDLLPGSDEGPYLEHEDTIPREQTAIPVSTQALLSSLEGVLRGVPPEDLKGAVDALGIGLTGRGPDIATILESTADLAKLFAERAPEVQRLLRNGTKVGGEFVESREDFAQAVEQLVIVSESLAGSREDLERLLQGSNTTSDELVRLLETYDADVNEFIHELAVVNDIQARHSDDLNQLFLYLPTALDRISSSFEPSTGMIRFGLITETGNHACSYGTERRGPADRSPKLPPKSAGCGTTANSGDSSSGSPVANTETPDDTALPGVDDRLSLEAGSDGFGVPGRMSEWTWTLYYLRGIQ
jgi:phospholipid/cholesterol/gamma-HCH transport system substrate-binding protein